MRIAKHIILCLYCIAMVWIVGGCGTNRSENTELSGNSQEDTADGTGNGNRLMWEDGLETETVFGSQYLRSDIVEINFLDTMENVPASSWDVSEDQSGEVMAWVEENVLYIAADGDINATSCRGLFANYTHVENIFFNNCFKTGNATNAVMMFGGCELLKNIDSSELDTSNIEYMTHMFSECSSLEMIDVSGFDTSNVTDISGMFFACESLTNVDVSGFDTSNVMDIASLFWGCESLTNVDVSGFDTSNVTNMASMFGGCESLTNVDVSGFDTSNVTDMSEMFKSCILLTKMDISGFDTSNVMHACGMLNGCGVSETLEVDNFSENLIDHMYRDCRMDCLLAEVDSDIDNEEDQHTISFNGDIVINQKTILILKSDGTVWGKGNNEFGNLGNGKRVDSDTWVKVESIENVVGIYAIMDFGIAREDGAHCYALCEDGSLWRWGGYIFTPEKVDIFSDVVQVSRPYFDENCYMTLECADGSKYVMIDTGTPYYEDDFIPYETGSVEDVFTYKYRLSDGQLVYYENGLISEHDEVLDISSTTFEERLETVFKNVFYVDGIEVESVNGNYFVGADSGNVYYFNWEADYDEPPTMENIENKGGKGYKQYIKSFLGLFRTGKVSTSGSNEYGRLGDGTSDDLYGGHYDITEADFECVKSNGEFVAGIDDSGNVWAWGKGFGSTPKIVVSYDEFVSDF